MNELVRDWKAEKKDLEEAFDIIADKLVKADAEINRLNTVIGILEAAAKRDVALITELCDALEIRRRNVAEDNLLQRAREATR